MKLVASALTMILIGVLGVWLWFDATTEDLQDTQGVVVSSAASSPGEQITVPGQDRGQGADQDAAAEDDAVTEGVQVGAADAAGGEAVDQGDAEADQVLADRTRLADAVVEVLRDAKVDMVATGVTVANSGGADDEPARAVDGRSGEPSSGSGSSGSGSGSSGSAPAVQPQPIQPAPAPAVPPGLCWDDDEWEECDDDWDDDDWDDDDWDDWDDD